MTLAQFLMRPKFFKQAKMSYEGPDNVKLYLFKFVEFVTTKYRQERS